MGACQQRSTRERWSRLPIVLPGVACTSQAIPMAAIAIATPVPSAPQTRNPRHEPPRNAPATASGSGSAASASAQFGFVKKSRDPEMHSAT